MLLLLRWPEGMCCCCCCCCEGLLLLQRTVGPALAWGHVLLLLLLLLLQRLGLLPLRGGARMLPLVKALQRGLRLPQLLLHLHAPAARTGMKWRA